MTTQELEMWMIFLITLLVLCQGIEDPCSTTSSYSITLPESITALAGFCVMIPCQFKLPPNCKMDPSSVHAIWLKGGTDTTKNQVSKNKIEMLGDMNQQNCTTIFKNVKKDDATMYYFRVETNFKFTFLHQHITLKVQDSPASPYVWGPSEVSEGSVVTLSCSAAAPCRYFPPNITWSLHTGNLTTHIQDEGDGRRNLASNLTFTASRSHHERDIFCMASYRKHDHRAQEAKSPVQTLRVLFPPSIVKASVSSLGAVAEGSRVTLICNSSEANPPVHNYTWYRDTQSSPVGSGPNITFNISSSDAGLYYCRAEHSQGAKESNSVILEIKVPPSVVEASVIPSGAVAEGSRVTLSCNSSEANPPVHNYTWYRDTQSSPVGSGPNITFNISSKSNNTGFYYCRAEHPEAGKDSGRVEVRLNAAQEDSMMYVIAGGGCVGFLLLLVGTGIALRIKKSKVRGQEDGQNPTQQSSESDDQDDPGSNTPNPTRDQNHHHQQPQQQEQQEQGDDEIHYGEISFSKKTQGGGDPREVTGQQGQAQGSTQESEYAEVRLSGQDDQVRYQKASDSEDLYAQVKIR